MQPMLRKYSWYKLIKRMSLHFNIAMDYHALANHSPSLGLQLEPEKAFGLGEASFVWRLQAWNFY